MCIFVFFVSAKQDDKFALKIIVIDAGHGGKDPGCLGKNGGREKNVTLAVALKLGHLIQENYKNIKVIYTRNTDVFVEVQERAVIANKVKADLFISIHCNSACFRDKKHKTDVCKEETHGAETYIMALKNENGNLELAKRENSAILLEDDYQKNYDGFDPNSVEANIIFSMYQNAFIDQSLSLAGKIQNEYSKINGREDKGVKRASLWVLWKTAMPSLLTEIGFLTNAEEEKYLLSDSGQNEIANGLFNAIRSYKNEMEGIKEEQKFENDIKPKDEVRVEKEVKPKVENEIKKEAKAKDTVITSDTPGLIKIEEEAKSAESLANDEVPVVEEEIKKPENENPNLYHKPIAKEEIPKMEQKNGEIIFKVQLFTSEKKILLNSQKFKGLKNISEYKTGNIFKYCAGETSKFEEAVHIQNEVRKGEYKQAFVVAFKNGERMDVNEARKIVQSIK